MQALLQLDGEIDIRCQEDVENACEEIRTVRSGGTENYGYNAIILQTAKQLWLQTSSES